MINVLLVEDHASYRQAIELVLEGEGDMAAVGQAGTAEEAGPAAAASQPDVAVIDLDLPDHDGLRALADIRAVTPSTACIILSAMTDDVMFGKAIEQGASAVLHKSIDIADLLDVIREVAEGRTVLPAEPTSRRLQALARSRDQRWHAQILEQSITPREMEVLELLAKGAGNRRIARELGISPDTVQTHIRNMLAKLAVGSRLEAVVKAIKLGLVAPPN